MDQSLFFTINRDLVQPWLDKPMTILSSWDMWWPFAVIGCLVLLFGSGFRGRAVFVCIAVSIGLVDGVIVQVIKKSVERPRPHQVLDGVRVLDLARATPRLLAVAMPLEISASKPVILPVSGRSFPSGHAANNFVLATVLIVFFRRWGWLYLIPAIAISWSRIYIGSHFPADVLAGALIASGVSLLVVACLEMLWRRFGSRVLPKVYENHPSLMT